MKAVGSTELKEMESERPRPRLPLCYRLLPFLSLQAVPVPGPDPLPTAREAMLSSIELCRKAL